MATFVLSDADISPAVVDPMGHAGLGRVILTQNARWFIRIRWMVIATLLMTALVIGALRGRLPDLNVARSIRWLLALSAILLSANLTYRVHVKRFGSAPSAFPVEANIWLQILVDLVVLTALVHLIGSVDTFIAFTYLFHIALACIFFAPRKSFLVTLFAASLYVSCVVMESAGWLHTSPLMAGTISGPRGSVTAALVFSGSAVSIWFVVWYLISSLSEAVRKRDQQLLVANRQLMRADQEKTREVLRTAHDLKAPFSGIESNIHLLRWQYWDEIPESVKAIIEKIQVRAHALSERIKDILLLGNIRSQSPMQTRLETTELRPLLEAVLDDLSERAESRNVSIQLTAPPTKVHGEPRQLGILLSNLVANAIFYSHDGGKVEIETRTEAKSVVVSIRDHGIGIREDALPKIFDEYYRTKEASQHNKLSTGLGLAIVKRITLNLNLKIRVSSELGMGTVFEVTIPQQKTTLTNGGDGDGKDPDNR